MNPEGFRFDTSPERLARLRSQVEGVVRTARERFDGGDECPSISAALSRDIDRCLVEDVERDVCNVVSQRS